MMNNEKISEEENDLLTVVMEECAEVIQAITKLQRFGPCGNDPVRLYPNRKHLAEEIGQLFANVRLLIEGGYVHVPHVIAARDAQLTPGGKLALSLGEKHTALIEHVHALLPNTRLYP
jgi:hypothetical protein